MYYVKFTFSEIFIVMTRFAVSYGVSKRTRLDANQAGVEENARLVVEEAALESH